MDALNIEVVDGSAVTAKSKTGAGVWSTSESFEAVHAETNAPGFAAVSGFVTNPEGTGPGIHGENHGRGPGVTAKGNTGAGLWATSEGFEGVHAETRSPTFGGVSGFVTHPDGTGAAIYGENQGRGPGVTAKGNTGAGVWATSEGFEAVHAETRSPQFGAISGFVTNPASTGAAIYGEHQGGKLAGLFHGDVEVTGDIRLTNADCAEDFDIASTETVEPGTVMVLGEEGTLHQSQQAYDRRVAGVISGAGDYKPGIVLDKQPAQGNRSPVALLGKVFCKVDASYAPIEVGDLLTTSDTPGHAMKAADPLKAFGSVIGKALRPLREGRGLVPILIALQ